MRLSVRRSLATTVLAPLLVLTTVACGDTDDTDDARGASNDSSTTVDQEDGDAGRDLDVDEFAATVRAGREDVTTASVDVRVDVDDDAGTGEGTLDLTGDRDALHLSLATPGDDGGEDEATFYMIDGVVLLKEDATSDAKFIKLEPELTDGVSFYSIFHPYQLTDLFLDHLQTVEHQGSEDVEGSAADHYLLTVDPEAVRAVLGAFAPDDAEAPDSVQQHLWLDSAGRIVKSDLELADNGDGMVIETTLSDFGGPEGVEPPPASEIDDLSDLGSN